MGYRMFTDSQGMEWQACDIVPRLAERRARERRVARVSIEHERRRDAERRHVGCDPSVEGQSLLRTGWLCFAAPTEKRRLAPIPSDWLRCVVARLEEYLRSAVPVPSYEPMTTTSDMARLGRRAG